MAAVELAIRVYVLRIHYSLKDFRPDAPAVRDPSHELTLPEIYTSSENPRILYRLRPSVTGIFQGVPYTSNVLGMREAEVNEKTSGTLRVIGLGDSGMFGWRVAVEDTYLKLLEGELRRVWGKERKIEVLNGAVPGYNAVQEAELFHESLAKLRPDLVIVQYDLNDINLSHSLVDANLFRLDHFYLSSLLDIWRGTYYGLDSMIAVGQEGTMVKKYSYMIGWEPLAQAYRRLRDECRALGITLIAVPETHDLLDPLIWARHRDLRYDRFRILCRRLEIPCVETFQPIFDCALANGFTEKSFCVDYPADPHPNRLRHALMARALFPDVLAALAKGRLPANLVESERHNADKIFLRKLSSYGLYLPDSPASKLARWTRLTSKILLHPEGRRYLNVKYYTSDGNCTPVRPLDIIFSFEGRPVCLRRHTALATGELWFDLKGLPEEDIFFQIDLSSVFKESPKGRELGISLLPFQYSDSLPPAPGGVGSISGAGARPNLPIEAGLYPAEQFEGENVRWTQRRSTMILPKLGNTLTLRYWIAHPGLSDAHPVTVSISIEGTSHLSSQHGETGKFEKTFDVGNFPGDTLRVEIETIFPFYRQEDSREMGVGLCDLEWK
ncbi:SGNH/GDSL hydrolase family protein [Candidatus Sumerlaeota bacterium]|nr:SGNH/GDSL hydrolase family protein [Candidatus Sumerlaeota bacterium]MBI3735836.1 SGNH/GDSL hydrolase family protein [Candidatus Sumerlaeota bacterium]